MTIWTTGLMLILTFVVSTCLTFSAWGKAPIDTLFGAVRCLLFFFLITGSPMFVSYFVSKNVKYAIPIFILFVSTVAYAIVYVWWAYRAVFFGGWDIPALLGICIMLLLLMIPVWIIAVVIEIRHRKKQAEP